ncbi:hypothetical protein [Homoserinimonas sp. OAct 916]|uniref:5-methylcytosine restriction system specificity protein McrC n=1 Tax=Homoserinimonas sp. OAct 916 TaxID=2211450 RepID=UPI000DBE9F9B|nr:hypothetical protein [Homoserinimonas sp. OAct 916]
MSERLHMREYEQVSVTAWRMQDLRDGAAQLHRQLRPTIRQFRGDGQGASLGNVVGSFSLPSGDVVEVAPKVRAEDWTTAVIHLLSEDTRLAVTGSQHSRPSDRKNDLTAALALEYARRLERALRKDGPMMVYERRHEVSRRWRGRLDVTTWARKSVVDPTLFPMGHDELSVVNGFTRGLSVVAGLLGRSAAGGEVASRLRRLQNAVIPGSPVPAFVNPAVARLRFPAQWASYEPAWDIAAAILRSQSVVGDPGRATGLEVAVEPWRLLETLLGRGLAALAATNEYIRVEPKATYPLLVDSIDISAARADNFPRRVEPDGLLKHADGRVLATFEAKYSNQPKSEHVYQSLATAAALSAPIAVLLYPWNEAPRRFDVTGFHECPTILVSIGVDLFGYRRGESDRELAVTLRDLMGAHSHALASR